jgi:hypothetical protein
VSDGVAIVVLVACFAAFLAHLILFAKKRSNVPCAPAASGGTESAVPTNRTPGVARRRVRRRGAEEMATAALASRAKPRVERCSGRRAARASLNSRPALPILRTPDRPSHHSVRHGRLALLGPWSRHKLGRSVAARHPHRKYEAAENKSARVGDLTLERPLSRRGRDAGHRLRGRLNSQQSVNIASVRVSVGVRFPLVGALPFTSGGA